VEIRDLTSLYRASNSIYNRKEADVAQLVEQSIRNRQVIGSSPIVGSTKFLSVMRLAAALGGHHFRVCRKLCRDCAVAQSHHPLISMIDRIPLWFQVRMLVDHRGAQISVTHQPASNLFQDLAVFLPSGLG
jgi:hypothetical protein